MWWAESRTARPGTCSHLPRRRWLSRCFLVLPVRLAVYGEDVFRQGGSDHGAGNTIFVVVELAFVAWAVWLLAVGLRILVRR